VRVGIFRCAPTDPRFEDSGPIRSGHLLVFPRTCVCITHQGGEPIVTDPNVVMFYNLHQQYRRQKVSEQGDWCEWFAFAPAVIASALDPYDSAAAAADQPFRFTHGPCQAQSYLQQRMVVEHLLRSPQPDPLFVEESMLGVLDAVIEAAYHLAPHSGHHRARRQPLVDEVRELLNAHYPEPITLPALAQQVHSSPFQLCRIFRWGTGYTIHQYLNQLRLRAALAAVAAGAEDLTALALDLGYASHSHFTQAFRQTFGQPPSHLRRFFTSLPHCAKI
jgi:AraC family transcriptional regulator